MLALILAAALGVSVDYQAKQIEAKILYVGADPAALFANLRYIHQKTGGGEAFPEEESFIRDGVGLPLTLGEIRGFKVKFILWTSPATQSPAARKLSMERADGVVFVATGDPRRGRKNTVALDKLRADLAAAGFALEKLPRVLQVEHGGRANDLTGAAVAARLKADWPATVDAEVTTGVGVFDALKSVAKQVLTELRKPADAGR